jgi:hypothetical protein
MSSRSSTTPLDSTAKTRRRVLFALAIVLLASVVVLLAFMGSQTARPIAHIVSSPSAVESSRRDDTALETDVEDSLAPTSPNTDRLELVERDTVAAPRAAAIPPALASGSIFGWVRDPLRHPDRFRGAKLQLRSKAATIRSRAEAAEDAHSIEVRDDGSFEARDLDLGKWRVSGKIAGCAPVSADVVIAAGSERVRIDFDLDPDRVVTIDLVDRDGNPFVESATKVGFSIASLVTPFACAEQPSLDANPRSSGRVLRSRSAIRGTGTPWYVMVVEASGRDRVWVGAALGDRALAFREVPLDVERVSLVTSVDDLRGAMGALTVDVVDDWDTMPRRDASVFLANALPVAPTKWTDARGRASFEALLEGEIQVRVRADDYVSANRSIQVTAGKTATLEIRLEPAISISGVARDEHDHPRGRLQVRAIPATGDDTRWQFERSTVTDDDGSFVLRGLAHREYTLIDAATRLSKTSWPQFTRSSVPTGMTFVDARSGSVEGVVVVIPLPKESTGSARGSVRVAR